jgi:PRELI-like family
MKCDVTFLFSLLQIIGTPKVCYASERSTVDPNERQMTLKTTNVTFGSFLSVDEVLLYKPHPTDPSRTLLQQQATVSVEGVPLSRYMEEVLTNNISFNASRGRLGLEWVINKINAEVSQLLHVPLKQFD